MRRPKHGSAADGFLVGLYMLLLVVMLGSSGRLGRQADRYFSLFDDPPAVCQPPLDHGGEHVT